LILFLSVRINVIGFDEESTTDPFYPVLISKSTDASQLTINTLIIGNGKTTHFVLIKSLNNLLRNSNTRKTKHHCVR
jgi:hypothetical protein